MPNRIIIWNDNTKTYNYRLSFDDTDKPDKLTLTKRSDDKNNIEYTWVFDIVSKEYIDNADTNLQNQIDIHDIRIDVIDAKNDEQDDRLDAIELKNVEQDSRLDANDVLNLEQNTRLDNVENKNLEQDDRLEAVELKNDEQDVRLENVESKNLEQDDRLDAIDGLNNGQNGRLDLIENKNLEQDNRLDNLDEQTRLINVKIATDVCKYFETTIPYTVPDLPLGLYRIHANFRVHTQFAIYPVPVMGLLVVNEDSGVKETYFNLQKADVSGGQIADINASYFDGRIDLSAILSRDMEFATFVEFDLTDFTFDAILIPNDFDSDKYVLKSGDIMYGDLDLNRHDLLNVTVNNPLV